LNFDSEANTDDGTCIDAVYGCTDQEAVNYDYLANVDDESCLYEGCTNPEALNFDSDADIDDGSCEIPGCIWNYWFICPSSLNPDATVGDWSYCEYIWGGCPSGLPTLPDQSPLISISDISGNHDDLYFYLGENRIGCMDRLASNYSNEVVIDNGSCMYLDIEEEANKIKIYPLPVTDKLFIELSNYNEVKEIIVHDVNQRVIYSSNEFVNEHHEINVSNFDSGVYFVVLFNENEKIIKKIVKE